MVKTCATNRHDIRESRIRAVNSSQTGGTIQSSFTILFSGIELIQNKATRRFLAS